MPDGFRLGAAWLEVSPNTDNFNEKLRSELAKDKSEVKVKVSPDTKDFKGKLDAEMAKSRSTVTVKAKADAKDFKSQLDRDLARSRGSRVSVKAEADTKEFTAKLDEAVKRRRTATIHVKYDTSEASKLGADAGGAFKGGFGNALKSGGAAGGPGGAASSASGGGGFAAGAMPVVAGAGIASLVTAAMAVLPAAMAAMGSVSGIAFGDALLTSSSKQIGKKQQLINKQFATQQMAFINDLKKNMVLAAAPLVQPLEAAFSQIRKWLPQFGRELKGFFSVLGPQIMPMVKGLEGFVDGFLPRLTGFLQKATGPLNLFWSAFSKIGTSLGKFFTNMGPGLQASMKVLASVLGDVGRLLEFIGTQASIAANAFGGSTITMFRELTNLLGNLLKWIVQIGGALMPFWSTIGHAISDLLNHVMPLVMPIFKELIKVVDQLIVKLEPFFISLLKAIAPIIPPLLRIVDLFAEMAIRALGPLLGALTPLLPVLSRLIIDLLKPLTVILQKITTEQLKQFTDMCVQLAPSLLLLANALLHLTVALMPMITQFTLAILQISEATGLLSSGAVRAVALFIKWVAKLVDWIAQGVEWFSRWSASAQHWQHLWSSIVNWLHATWSKLVNWVHGFWSDMVNTIHHGWATAINFTHSIWSAAVNWLHSVWSNITNTLHSAWSYMVNFVHSSWSNIANFTHRIWADIANGLHNGWANIVNQLHAFWSRMVNIVHSAWSDIANFTHRIWADIANGLHNGWANIVNQLHAFWSKMANLVHSFWSAIANDTHMAWNRILDWLHTLWSNMVNEVHRQWSNLTNVIHSAWSGIANDTHRIWSDTVNWIAHKLPGMMADAFRGVVRTVGHVWDELKGVAAGPINWVVDHVSGGVDTITNALHLGKPLAKFEHFRMAGGGVVPGYAPGHDVYNAKLAPGEGVLVPEAVQAIGPGTVNALNQQYGKGRKSSVMGGVGHFAGGGINPIGAIGHAVSGAANAVGNAASGVWHDITGIAKVAWNTITDPVGEATKVLSGLLGKIPGEGIGVAMAKDIGKGIISAVVNDIIGASVGSGNGAAIAASAQRWNGHKYVWGGPSNPTSGWDCSSFASYILGTNGIALPGGFHSPSNTHGPATGQYLSGYGTHKPYSKMSPGDLYVSGTHMGIVIGPGKGFAARSTATGTGPQNVMPGVYNIITPPGVGGGGGALGANFTSANAMAVGREMFSYLQAAAHMTPIAAAGAIASIYGESAWNPESAGTGGRGLIGWTPPGTLPNSAFTGNAVHDLNAQLPEIIKFISNSGDWGVISRMNQATSILEAANLWGRGVERFGINDVHGPGLALAAQILGSGARGIKGINAMAGNPTPLKPGFFAGGTDGAPSGWAWVGEEGPELVNFNGGETVLDNDTSSMLSDDMGNLPGFAAGTKKPVKKKLTAKQQAAHNASVKRHQQVLARQQAARLAREVKAANKFNTNYSHILEGIINVVGNSDKGNIPAIEKESLAVVKAMDKMFATKWDHTIEKSFAKPLTRQTNALIAIANKQAAIQTKMAQISGYANTVAGNLTSYADVSNISLGNVVGAPSQGRQITLGLQSNLNQLKVFASALKGAAKKGINTAFLQQAIAMGPGQGTQYLNAVSSSGVANIKALNAAYAAINSEATVVGQQAADTVYGQTGTGKNFLHALKAQSAALGKAAENMGITMARTLQAELRRLAKAPSGLSADIAHMLTQDIAKELAKLHPKKRARGGPFAANDLLLVGEEGPELAAFGQAGRIINNAQTSSVLSGSSGSINVNFYGTQYPNNEQIQNLMHEMSLALEVN